MKYAAEEDDDMENDDEDDEDADLGDASSRSTCTYIVPGYLGFSAGFCSGDTELHYNWLQSTNRVGMPAGLFL